MDVHFGPGEIAVLGVVLGGVVAALVTIFKLLISAKDAALADWKSIATDATRVLTASEARRRTAEGGPTIQPVAAVVPEHHSPATPAQQTTADQATLRAAVTAAALSLGIPPRGGPVEMPEGGSAHDLLISKTDAVQAILSVPAEGVKEKAVDGEPEGENP